MTIKEIENRTGLARTNIRFYEAEGLISPPRLPNGYRDYSEEDAATLERVKLLRTLHMPLEDIKALQAGDQTLTQALSAHLERLEEEQADLARSRTVCQGMQREGAEFSTLDAPRYLLELDRQDAKELEADQLERVTAPWRRFFARTLDLNLYALLFSLLLLPLGIHGPVASLSQNSSFGKELFTLAALSAAYTGMLLLLEPLLLSRFGTTPGKALLGLRVTDPEGRRLTWREAFRRTLTVVSRGEGWYFFPYQLYRNLRSYRSCTAGGILPWEEDTTLHQKDKKGWRVAVCLLGLYLLCAPSMSWNVKPLSPPHHGDMTVAELAENYDWAADLYDLSPTWRLDQEGNWQENFSLWSGPTTAPPPLAYRLEDGQVTGVTYALSADVETYRSTEYTDQITALVLAFTQTQAGYDPYLGMTPLPYFPLLHALDDTMAPTFDLELYGVHVTCDSSLDTQADQGELRLVMEKQGADPWD